MESYIRATMGGKYNILIENQGKSVENNLLISHQLKRTKMLLSEFGALPSQSSLFLSRSYHLSWFSELFLPLNTN